MTPDFDPRNVETFWDRLREAIRRDPALQENLWFGACAVIALVGVVLARTFS